MKHFLSITLFFLVTILTGCSKEDTEPQSNTSSPQPSFTNEVYSYTINYLNQNLDSIYQDIFGADTRVKVGVLNGWDLVDKITTISSDEYGINTTVIEEYEEKHLQSENEFWNAVKSLSSEQDVEDLEYFIDNYIAMGGHNIAYLTESVKNHSVLIQTLMSAFAAKTDFYLPAVSQTRVGSYCYNWLYSEVIKWVRVDETDLILEILTDIEIGAVDPVAGLISAGLDVYSALSIADGYNQCKLLHG